MAAEPYKTKLRFFSSRRERNEFALRAALFPFIMGGSTGLPEHSQALMRGVLARATPAELQRWLSSFDTHH